ncbi:MAG: hypothetical protein AAF125_23040 [Chloroflexota bacterium]
MTNLPRPGSLAKATMDTKFHIDYEWWDNATQLRLYMLSHIQDEEERERLGKSEEGAIVDYVHPETGEVFRADELNLALQRAAQEDDFINPQASMVDNIFRVFLRNGNQPRSPRELENEVDKSASIILKTIGGTTVYKGIRPVSDE